MVAYPRTGHVVRVKNADDPTQWVDVLRLDYLPAVQNGGGQVQAHKFDWMDTAGDGTGASANPRRGMEQIDIYDQDGLVVCKVPAIKNMVTSRSGQFAQWHFTNDPAANTARQVINARVCAVDLPDTVDPTTPMAWEDYLSAMQAAIDANGYDAGTYVTTAIPASFGFKRNSEDDYQGQGGIANLKHVTALDGLGNIVSSDEAATTWLDPFQIIVNRSPGGSEKLMILYFLGDDSVASYCTISSASKTIPVPIGDTIFSSDGSASGRVWPATGPHAVSENFAVYDDVKAWTTELQTGKYVAVDRPFGYDHVFVMRLPKGGPSDFMEISFAGDALAACIIVPKDRVTGITRHPRGLGFKLNAQSTAKYNIHSYTDWLNYVVKSDVWYYFPTVGLNGFDPSDGINTDAASDWTRYANTEWEYANIIFYNGTSAWWTDYDTGGTAFGNPFINPQPRLNGGFYGNIPVGVGPNDAAFFVQPNPLNGGWTMRIHLKSGLIIASDDNTAYVPPPPPGSALGPDWTPNTAYAAGTIVWDAVGGGNYIMLRDQTSGAVFVPKQKIGNQFYNWTYP